MTITISGKQVEVSGKVRNVTMDRNRLGYTDNVESVKEYDNAIYIYAKGAYDGEKHQIVFYKK